MDVYSDLQLKLAEIKATLQVIKSRCEDSSDIVSEAIKRADQINAKLNELSNQTFESTLKQVTKEGIK